MPQQYTLVAKPVILSENKQNAIPHGRPLSPIGTVRSARPFFVPRPAKDSFTEDKHGDTISVNKSPSTDTSVTGFVDYHKLANENLMTINNNLSLMLKESFAGIDNICQKVRLCLLDANTIKPPENLQILASEVLETQKSQKVEICKSEVLEIRKVENRTDTSITESLETRTAPYRRESFQLLSTCDEEVESSASIDEVPELPDDANEITAEIVEEIEEEDGCEKEDQRKGNGRKSKRPPSISPFFTVLNPTTQSAESVGVNILQSLSSKIGLSRKCTTENFQETMREVEKLNDYEDFLTSMVEGINREIEECYSDFPRIEGMMMEDDKNKPNNKKGDEKKDGKSSSTQGHKRKGKFGVNDDLKRFHDIHKSQRDLMEDQFSENDLTCRHIGQRRLGVSLYTAKMDFTYPDVYRKRAITDLHKRLEAQIEANDSLIFFQKLMAKSMKHMNNDRPSSVNERRSNDKPADSYNFKTPMQYLVHPKHSHESSKQRSLSDLSRKYQDSLWFRQKKSEAKRNKRDPTPSSLKKKREKKSKKDKQILPQSYTIESTPINEGKTSVVNKACFKSPSQVSASVCSCKIKVTNNQPMSDAQKCKLHWMRAKYSQLRQKKLKYLDILDDITKNDLLPIKAEYPRRDAIKSTIQVKESYLHKLLYGTNKDTQNAWDQLFLPAPKCSKENFKKCSMTNIVNKEDTIEERTEPNLINETDIEETFIKKTVHTIEMETTCELDKGDVIRKLSKYIFAEESQQITPNHVFTVMPVHVFYDNARIPPDTRRHGEMPSQKLPLVLMKETKEFVRKAEWNEATVKKSKPTRVVYDPILRKIEKEIRMAVARPDIKSGTSKMGQTNSWSPKNFSQYCSPPRQPAEARLFNIKINPIDRNQQRHRNMDATNRTVPIAEIYKRSPKPSIEQVHPSVPPLWNSPHTDAHRYQKDMDVRQKIQKTISAEATSRMKSDQQRKIWENKYGKSVGQKLLNFIEKQPDQYQLPVPKYALPSKSGPKGATQPGKHQMMLEQLRTLKQKNDSIQSNIQKAIVVIENKMVDILSKPTTSESIEAFDAMEKEITNVLSLMRASNIPRIKKEKTKEGYEYGGDISDELFQRLDRILESPGMSGSGRSSKNSLKKEEKPKRTKKLECSGPPLSTDMNQVCFSSTSATGEEKFTITAISPKRPCKSPTRTPYLKNAKVKPAPEDMSTISNELRKLENELKRHDSTNDLDHSNAETEVLEAETPTEQMPPKRSSILKHRRSVLGQEQVVNIALISQTNPEGSAGDQLKELKKLLENELKSVDASDERTHSIAVSFSQGDYGGQNGVKSKEVISENTELDVDSVLEEKDEMSLNDQNTTTIDSMPKISDIIRPIHVVIKNKHRDAVKPERPKTPVNHQPKGSQLSLDMTGPYFTPLTSPVTKTRCKIDEVDETKRCSIVEEEKQSSISQIEEKSDLLNHDVQVDTTGDDNQKENQETSLLSKNEEEPKMQNKDGDGSNQCCHKEENGIKVFMDNDDSKSEKSDKDSFYENVNRIISRVENVYNQLEEFEVEMLQEETNLLANKVPTYEEHEHEHDPLPPGTPDLEPDLFLAPIMHAVKDLRNTIRSDKSPSSSRKSSPRINRSSSLYNVLSFLDNLSDIKEERTVEVYTPRICFFAYIVHIPQIFYQYIIQNQSSFTTLSPVPEEATQSNASEGVAIAPLAPTPSVAKPLSTTSSPLGVLPKKRSGCLKSSSTSHSNVNAVTSKSKQKVSFLLLKEEKSTQVTSCPFHSVARILSQQKISTSTTTGSVDNSSSTRRDEQVSAYLDACENKSVDKMSLADDETTYQSTFEFSDENSSAKSSKMPEQIVQNLQETLEKEGKGEADAKKNVVEIFRNSYGEETGTQEIKVLPKEGDADVGELKSIPEGIDREDVHSKEVIKVEEEEQNRQPAVKVFYDTYKSGKDYIDLTLLAGIYNEQSILRVKSSLSRNLAVKKQNSLEKLLKNLNEEILSTEILKEASLLEPLKNLNEFIDSNLLKEAVEKRRVIRMLRRKSSLTIVSNEEIDRRSTDKQIYIGDGEKENLLKGFYVFVYLLMFTALNLEYKCVH